MQQQNSNGSYYIYRLKRDISAYLNICYQAFKDLDGYQKQINVTSYEIFLQGELQENETPSSLYNKIHKKELREKKIVYLRASDIFVFNCQEDLQVFYLDPIGFTQIASFFCS